MTQAKMTTAGSRTGLLYLLLTVAGFSYWFFLAVPFATHRESYMWLAMVSRGPVGDAFGTISTTWRPLAQVTTWLGFVVLNPSIFPTSAVRQALLQCLIYGLFFVSWAIIYSTVRQRRCFAVLALIVGGVFFPAYIHLFHIYGLFYVPVFLMLAVLLRLYMTRGFEKWGTVLAIGAIVLAFWHPFSTAIFLGFYFGHYVSSFWSLNRREHVRTWLVLVLGAVTVLILLAMSPRPNQPFKLLGFVTSYRTNEVNLIASVVAWGLAQVTVFAIPVSTRQKGLASVAVAILGAVLLWYNVPLLLLWVLVAMYKLVAMRRWALMIPLVVTALLPYGGGLGGPVYGLFVMVMATFITALEWSALEDRLAFLDRGFVTAFLIALALVDLGMRGGLHVPVVSAAANPLLAERERTYQLEQTLSWLAASDYCNYSIAFAERGGDPVDSVESAITRRNRPPTTIEDAGLFWDAVLRCKTGPRPGRSAALTITFGGQKLSDATTIFELPGPHAGPIAVWVGQPQ